MNEGSTPLCEWLGLSHQHTWRWVLPVKAADRNRTGNLEITNHALCQLSYGGGGGSIPQATAGSQRRKSPQAGAVVGDTGFEVAS